MPASSEIWRPVTGFEGRYEVSSKGRVRSLDRIVHVKGQSDRKKKGVLLKPGIKDNGYLQVCFEGYSNKYVHRLVAEAFLEKPDGTYEIDHINTDRTDNRVENLRWVNRTQNNLNPKTVIKRRIPVVYVDTLTNEVLKEFPGMHIAEITTGMKGISAQCQAKTVRGRYRWMLKSDYYGSL